MRYVLLEVYDIQPKKTIIWEYLCEIINKNSFRLLYYKNIYSKNWIKWGIKNHNEEFIVYKKRNVLIKEKYTEKEFFKKYFPVLLK